MNDADDLFGIILVIMVIFLLLIIFSLALLVNRPTDYEEKLINQYHDEYSECIAELPRNKDCTLTGFVFTVTTKQD